MPRFDLLASSPDGLHALDRELKCPPPEQRGQKDAGEPTAGATCGEIDQQADEQHPESGPKDSVREGAGARSNRHLGLANIRARRRLVGQVRQIVLAATRPDSNGPVAAAPFGPTWSSPGLDEHDSCPIGRIFGW